jgi:transposase
MTKSTSNKKFFLKTPAKAKVDVSNRRKLPHLTPHQREMMHLLHNDGKKPSEIAALIGCNKSTVTKSLKKIQQTNSFENKPRSGRPPKISPRISRKKFTLSSCNRRLTASEIRAKIHEKFGIEISSDAVSKTLRKWGFKGRVAIKKPLLSPRNMIKLLEWAEAHVNWTKEPWEKVIWTDESPFKIFGSNRKQIVRRFDKEDLRLAHS